MSYPISLCDNIAPRARSLASVVKINGLLKSRNCRTGSVHNAFFNLSKDSKLSFAQLNLTFLRNSFVIGLAILLHEVIKLR